MVKHFAKKKKEASINSVEPLSVFLSSSSFKSHHDSVLTLETGNSCPHRHHHLPRSIPLVSHAFPGLCSHTSLPRPAFWHRPPRTSRSPPPPCIGILSLPFLESLTSLFVPFCYSFLPSRIFYIFLLATFSATLTLGSIWTPQASLTLCISPSPPHPTSEDSISTGERVLFSMTVAVRLGLRYGLSNGWCYDPIPTSMARRVANDGVLVADYGLVLVHHLGAVPSSGAEYTFHLGTE